MPIDCTKLKFNVSSGNNDPRVANNQMMNGVDILKSIKYAIIKQI